MKATTWIAIVLTLWATVDLGERAYAYYVVYDAQQTVKRAVYNACLEDYRQHTDAETWDTIKGFYEERCATELKDLK